MDSGQDLDTCVDNAFVSYQFSMLRLCRESVACFVHFRCKYLDS